MFSWRLAFIVLFLITATACGNSTSPSMTNVSASINASGFNPNPINISVGSSVTWTNSDAGMHGVVADNGAFQSGSLANGAQYSFTFPAAGAFTYHDLSNAGAIGTVNVTASSSSPY